MNIRKIPQALALCFIALNLVEKSVLHSGLCKERSTKQATDNFQHRALLRKVMEALKRPIFNFTIANLVNEEILYFLITTDA